MEIPKQITATIMSNTRIVVVDSDRWMYHANKMEMIRQISAKINLGENPIIISPFCVIIADSYW